jgi:hypothetical protein
MTRKLFFRIAAASLVFFVRLSANQPAPGSSSWTDLLSRLDSIGRQRRWNRRLVEGKVVVPDQPRAQNAAAADLAARIGFATAGFTPPVVISAAEDRAGDGNPGPRIYIGRPSPGELEPEGGRGVL